jgi:quercetin dioxygenase-like cupin family protein
MNAKFAWFTGAALLSVSVALYSAHSAQAAAQSGKSATAQTSKPVKINRLYTGPDGQTHAEEILVDFGPGGVDAFKLKAGAGAEIRRAPPGRVVDWHPAPRRQYVITLSGRGEIELIDGTKIQLGPGSINLAEDLTGKGHITRVIGNEDRVTIAIPVSDR